MDVRVQQKEIDHVQKDKKPVLDRWEYEKAAIKGTSGTEVFEYAVDFSNSMLMRNSEVGTKHHQNVVPWWDSVLRILLRWSPEFIAKLSRKGKNPHAEESANKSDG